MNALLFIFVIASCVSVRGNPVKQTSSKNGSPLPLSKMNSARKSNVLPIPRGNDADKAKGQLSLEGRPVYSFSASVPTRGGGAQSRNIAAFKASFKSRTTNNQPVPVVISNARPVTFPKKQVPRPQASIQSVSNNARGNNNGIEYTQTTNTTNRGKSFSNFKRLHYGLNSRTSASARPGHIEIWNWHNSFPGMNLTPEQNKRISAKLDSMRKKNITSNNTSFGVSPKKNKLTKVNSKPPAKSKGETESEFESTPNPDIKPLSANLPQTKMSNISYNTLSFAPTKNAKYIKTQNIVNTLESSASKYNDPGRERWNLLNSNSNNTMSENQVATGLSSTNGSNNTALEYRKKSNSLSVIESRKRFRSLYTVKVKASDFKIKNNGVDKSKIDGGKVQSSVTKYGNATKHMNDKKGKNLRKQIIEATNKIKALKQSIIKSKKTGNLKSSMGNIKKKLKNTLTKVKTLQSRLKGKGTQIVNDKTENMSLSGKTTIKTTQPSIVQTDRPKKNNAKQKQSLSTKNSSKDNNPESTNVTKKQITDKGKLSPKTESKTEYEVISSRKAKTINTKINGMKSSQVNKESGVGKNINTKQNPSKQVVSKVNHINKFSYKTKSNAVLTRKEKVNNVYVKSMGSSVNNSKTNKQLFNVVPSNTEKNRPFLQRTDNTNRQTKDTGEKNQLTKNGANSKTTNNLKIVSSDGEKVSMSGSINVKDKLVITNILSSTNNRINVSGKNNNMLTKPTKGEGTNVDKVKVQLTPRNKQKEGNDGNKGTNDQGIQLKHGKTNEPKNIYNKRLISPISAFDGGRQSGKIAGRTSWNRKNNVQRAHVERMNKVQDKTNVVQIHHQQQNNGDNIGAQSSKRTGISETTSVRSRVKGASEKVSISRQAPSQKSLIKSVNNAGERNVLIKPVRSDVNVKAIQQRKVFRENNIQNQVSAGNRKFASSTRQGASQSQKFSAKTRLGGQNSMTTYVTRPFLSQTKQRSSGSSSTLSSMDMTASSKPVSPQTQQRLSNARDSTGQMSTGTSASRPMSSVTRPKDPAGQSSIKHSISTKTKSLLLSKNRQTNNIPSGSVVVQNSNVSTNLQAVPKIAPNTQSVKNIQIKVQHTSAKSKQAIDQQMAQKASALIKQSREKAQSARSAKVSTIGKQTENVANAKTAAKRNGYWYIDRNGQYQWYEVKPTNGLGKNSPDPSYGYYYPPTTQASAKFGSSALDYPYYDYPSSKPEQKKEEEEES